MDFAEQLLPYQAKLRRWCIYLTHHPEAADDLVQETLIEAWRQQHKLTDPAGIERWLMAISRFVCLRWQRTHYRHHLPSLPLEDELDLTHEMDENPLADLLTQALAMLPPATRDLLTAYYLDEQPLAMIAARLHVPENGLYVRLHRGKVALAEVIKTHLRDQALDYGLVTAADHWQPTRLWCYACGQAAQGFLILRCDRCSFALEESTGVQALIGEISSLKSALTRLMNWSMTYFIHGMEHCCEVCGHRLRVETHPRQTSRGAEILMEVICYRCGKTQTLSLYGQAIHLPAGQQFWRKHPRLRLLPHQYLEVEGQPAVLTTLDSLTSTAQLHVISALASGQVLKIEHA